ncbi:MAG: hypothetical protein UIM24_00465 [Clostridia bacterium]|nr:hypothetical protein [Clostridia bacterium]
MILDIFCIIISIVISALGNNAFTKKVEKQILERYLDLGETDEKKSTQVYSVFSDKEAIEQVFSPEQSLDV